MITVLFFAQLREQLKTSSAEINIATPCTVADIQHELVKQNPQWDKYISDQSLLTSVNQDMVDLQFMVNANDEVAFFPPVTGG